jgi:hypothetical protein
MFELLFKYPASIFHKGQFVFLTPWPVWVLAIAILAAAVALFWHERRNHGMLSGARPWPRNLRKAAHRPHPVLLWHPALSIATLRPQQNVVAVLVDDSRSMSINDSSGTREAAAQSALNSGMLKGLSDRFQVRLYKFGREPERIQTTDHLRASATASRLGETLERAAERPRYRSAIVVERRRGQRRRYRPRHHRRHTTPAHSDPHYRLRQGASR